MKLINVTSKAKIIVFLCLTILVAGLLSYRLINNAIVYEITENSNITIHNISETNSDINKIPDMKDGYLINYENQILYVYSTDKQLLYTDFDIKESAFSLNDLRELSQNGMFISELTELIELINYLKS